MIKNSLHSLAIQSGLSLQARLFTRKGEQQLLAVSMSPVMSEQREQWLALLNQLNQRITETEWWLRQQAQKDPRISLLRTHTLVRLASFELRLLDAKP